MINHAIIGCGRVAKNHLYAISKLDKICLVAVCDKIDVKGTALYPNINDITYFQNHQELIASGLAQSVYQYMGQDVAKFP